MKLLYFSKQKFLIIIKDKKYNCEKINNKI